MGKSVRRHKAYIFLNGFYHARDRQLVRRQLRAANEKPLIIAVDGGLSFLQKTGIRPDVWLSDFDSAPRIRKEFLEETAIFAFPSEKDKTDAELALDLCRHRKIAAATIWGWYDRGHETDHLLGNLMLSLKFITGPQKIDLEFAGTAQRVFPVRNGRVTIIGSRRRRLSVVPLDKRIRLTVSGVKYPARNLHLCAGDTVSLRNEIIGDKAVVAVIGTALVLVGG